jgi:hypothetical protein
MRKSIESYPATHQPALLSAAVTIRNLLQYYGHNMSLPMIFGLSSAMGFVYGTGGRARPLAPDFSLPDGFAAPVLPNYLRNACRVTNIWTQNGRTKEPLKIRQIIQKYINEGRPVIFEVEALRYFSMLGFPEFLGIPVNGPDQLSIGGYWVTVTGYDDERDSLILSEASLGEPVEIAANRFLDCCIVWGGYIPPEGEWTVFYVPPKLPSWKFMIANSIRWTVQQMLHPFHGNPGYRFGLPAMESFFMDIAAKTGFMAGESLSISRSLYSGLIQTEPERSGFRKMYAAFLEESAGLLANPKLRAAADNYTGLHKLWAEMNDWIIKKNTQPEKGTLAGEQSFRELGREILAAEKNAVRWLDGIVKDW